MDDMETGPRVIERRKAQPIYVVSGGTGATGELLVRTVLAQFRDVDVPIIIRRHIRDMAQIETIVDEAKRTDSAIVHTMVNATSRAQLIRLAEAEALPSFDLASPLLSYLSRVLDQEPLGQPGLYRELHEAYFERIEAIEFTVAHDDAKRPEGLPDAEIVLLGVSRVGKTPLSMYLSILGWRVANIPFVLDMPLPAELEQVDPRRIVGLMIEPIQLVTHRRWRQTRTGIPEGAYVNRDAIVEELRAANHYFFQHKYPVVNTTDKPIESCAEEVVAVIAARMAQ